MLYLTGPKNAECVPRRKRAPKRIAALRVANPTDARSTMPISRTFTARTSRALSYLSASSPAIDEKRKNGATKSAVVTLTSVSADMPPHEPAPRVSETTAAVRSTLSLSAPRSCVVKSGPKRRVRRSAS
jgi:hypothetical protein